MAAAAFPGLGQAGRDGAPSSSTAAPVRHPSHGQLPRKGAPRHSDPVRRPASSAQYSLLDQDRRRDCGPGRAPPKLQEVRARAACWGNSTPEQARATVDPDAPQQGQVAGDQQALLDRASTPARGTLEQGTANDVAWHSSKEPLSHRLYAGTNSGVIESAHPTTCERCAPSVRRCSDRAPAVESIRT